MTKQKVKSTITKNKNIRKQKADIERVRNGIEMLRIADEVKMITFYTLRNMGWGEKRLKDFNDKWNTHFVDMVTGHFTVDDVVGVMMDECNLTTDDLMIKKPMEAI